MGTYSVPEEIRAQKPSGTMVKRIGNDRFYVYEYSTTKERIIEADGSQRWKTKTIMGRCIGTITAEKGFIPNNTLLAKDAITVKNYGDFAFVVTNAQHTYNLLCEKFNTKDATQIFTVAVIFFVNGFTYMKNVKTIYDLSYLSFCYPDVDMGYKALHKLYQNLGSRQSRVREFEQMMLEDSCGRIAIDGHVIACTSEKNDLSEFGYKALKFGTEQINWLTAYDVASKEPLLSQVYSGADPDKVSVKALLNRYQFTNTEFLVDRGFNTAQDKELMSENGNTYIVPMISGRKDYRYVLENLRFDRRRYFVYNKNKYASMVYYQEFRNGNVRYLAFQDTTRAGAERQDYIKRMESGKQGYTNEGLLESEPFFGLFLLETNSQALIPENVFCHYKERWTIETYYNYIRNDVDFNALYQQDFFCTQGLSFIVTITGMIYHDVRRVADFAGMKVKDIMQETKKLKMVLDGNKWAVHNHTKGVRELCEKAHFTFPSYAI